MKKVLLMALVVICSVIANAQNKKNTVAIYVEGNVSRTEKSIIEAKAVSRISMCKDFKAVERTKSFSNSVTKEYDYQISGEVSEEDILKFGKKYAAHYVAVLNVTKAEDYTVLITARLINVQSGEIIKSVDSNREVYSTDDLIALTNNVTYRLVTKN